MIGPPIDSQGGDIHAFALPVPPSSAPPPRSWESAPAPSSRPAPPPLPPQNGPSTGVSASAGGFFVPPPSQQALSRHTVLGASLSGAAAALASELERAALAPRDGNPSHSSASAGPGTAAGGQGVYAGAAAFPPAYGGGIAYPSVDSTSLSVPDVGPVPDYLALSGEPPPRPQPPPPPPPQHPPPRPQQPPPPPPPSSPPPPPPPPPPPDDGGGGGGGGFGFGNGSGLIDVVQYNGGDAQFRPRAGVREPTVEESRADHTRLEGRLQLYGLREKHIAGDGNCQFRALADQLWGSADRHAEVRRTVLAQLRAKPGEYEVFVTEPYDAYLSRMARDGTWGDHLTLQARGSFRSGCCC